MEGTNIERYTNALRTAVDKLERPKFTIVAKDMVELLKQAGFVDVGYKRFPTPLGPWAKGKKQKEVGNTLRIICDTGFQAYALALMTRVLHMSADEVNQLVADAKEDLENKKIHVIYTLYAVLELNWWWTFTDWWIDILFTDGSLKNDRLHINKPTSHSAVRDSRGQFHFQEHTPSVSFFFLFVRILCTYSRQHAHFSAFHPKVFNDCNVFSSFKWYP
jgi:hypothetical protein